MNDFLEVRPSLVHGKGVFTKRMLLKDTILIFDVLPLSNDLLVGDLKKYAFPYNGKKEFCLCLGQASFFNHNENPNIKISGVDRINKTKSFKIISNIKEGEELFLYYNDSFNNKL